MGRGITYKRMELTAQGNCPPNSASGGSAVKSNSMKPAGFERMAFLFEAHTKGMPLNIRVQDAAALTSMSVSKLNLYRLKGGGPRFLRFGRSVRYRLADVVNWMDAPTYASTSEADMSKATQPMLMTKGLCS